MTTNSVSTYLKYANLKMAAYFRAANDDEVRRAA